MIVFSKLCLFERSLSKKCVRDIQVCTLDKLLISNWPLFQTQLRCGQNKKEETLFSLGLFPSLKGA